MAFKKNNASISIVQSSILVLVLFVLNACTKVDKAKNSSSTLFELIDNSQSNIHFTNSVKENLYFNFINYAYIYNGAGVAAGDINNDGLEDLYFTSNQESNKLYLNGGDFKFQDITTKAQVEDKVGWTTGVSMVDINNDGWLDIYVCKSGSLRNHNQRKNKLYINQKNKTFKEEAKKYGLDHFGFSVQAYFFDYDNDGDLDAYLVNHRSDFQNNTIINPKIQDSKEPYHSDQLFRNDGHIFTNITKHAGLENKAWGLSASIGDFNNDNLLDIYVANDFLEPDFLYINQGDGTFKDEALSRFKHISANSMGSDYADINNDLLPDLIVLDMLAEDHIRSKENMATMSTDNFNLIVESGYHHQYMSNMLQLNNADGTYSDIGQLAGVSKTDWSWAPLIADFDNDGYKDVFVTNGIENDLSNQDFRNQMRSNIQNRKKVSLDEAINMMPSAKLNNYIFQNTKNLRFKNQITAWGFEKNVNSSGAVYSDLDNDGDLDLVTNNQGEAASVYKNNTESSYIKFSLEGSEQNRFGIGSTVSVYSNALAQSKTLFLSRGYQSSVTNKLHFGLGSNKKIDSISITWPDQKTQVLRDVAVNQSISLKHTNSIHTTNAKTQPISYFKKITPADIGIDYVQKENVFDDFKLQLLLPQKQSEKGAPMAIGDVNGDGLDDLFLGNAQGESGALYIQNKDGVFKSSNEALFQSDKAYEDTDAAFVDIDSDGDLDIYVTSGGYEIPENNALLQDRLYINNGKGSYSKGSLAKNLMHSKKILFADYDKDGDLDAFLAGGVISGKYPLAYPSKLLENHNGILKDVTSEKLTGVNQLSMANDGLFSDFDLDGDLDLIVVGEWMGIQIFENSENAFTVKTNTTLNGFVGWCQSIKDFDFDHDGDQDYLIGNWGNNNKFHPTIEKPLHIYADYLDGNKSFDVVLSKVSKTGDLLPVRGKECSSQQTPFINKKLKTYKAFAASTLPDIYGADKLKNAYHYEANNFNTVLIKNNGKRGFEIIDLPVQAQFSPTLGFEIHDLNYDGIMDVFGIGNIYDAEVETIRYDASAGYILLGNEDGGFTITHDLNALNHHEAQAIKKIKIKGQVHFIILNKNNSLNILRHDEPQ
ncbi:VCBS repeat-containing protein [Algibacter mikhailovii]|uniref:ASPIC/UnbV domain-containing protein n=1 Tax=Algibacter mikhailovii TaxID=425498 RepID=A0A918R5N4_9FLAO|nr:VCBS repeat-containing protein [Algibacter mikhailovii]GGZ85783.1 hypothetical protein GCM10007028_25070 [Algibacter mikhailovii]